MITLQDYTTSIDSGNDIGNMISINIHAGVNMRANIHEHSSTYLFKYNLK